MRPVVVFARVDDPARIPLTVQPGLGRDGRPGAPRDDLGRNDARTLDAYGHLNMTELARPIHVFLGDQRDDLTASGSGPGSVPVFAAMSVVYASVGAAVAVRRPGNGVATVLLARRP